MKTIMKTTIITASFLLLSTLTYGQTKEETISWLTEKFNSYIEGITAGSGKFEITSINVNSCEITVNTNHPSGKRVYVLQTQGLQVIDSGWKNDSIEILTIYTRWDSQVEKYSLSTIDDFYLIKGENDLHQRVQKALTHLATFCQKKKETF
jgi:hypothetical protein